MKRRSLTLATFAVAVTAFAAHVGSASAAPVGPVMDINSVSQTSVAPGQTFDYFVWISNVGDRETTEPRLLDVEMPTGVEVVAATDIFSTGWTCELPDSSSVHCENSVPSDPHSNNTRNGEIRLTATVDGAAAEGPVVALFNLSGGGAASVESADETLISAAPLPFGVESFDAQVARNVAGDPSTQAAAHPFSISTSIFFNTINNTIPRKGPVWPVEAARDILVDLPVGFAGYPPVTGTSRCTVARLANAEGVNARPLCPPGAQVGESKVITADGFLLSNALPVFNMVPPPGVPARFAFNIAGTVVLLDAELRSGSDYGLSVNVRNVSEGIAVAGTELTFWGVPADSSHDANRACSGQAGPGEGGPSCATELPRQAFLRNPTSCQGPQPTTLRIDSWTDPGDFREASFLSHNPPAFPFPPSQWGAPQGATGCADVPFEPTITVRATNHEADSPTGLDVDLSMPQSSDPDTIGQADVKSAHVTLPEGMVVNPAAAAGLVGCSEADVGLHDTADPKCPDASKIGTVEIDSPQLSDPLHGSIYQATQFDNPAHSLLGFYTVAKGPGLIIKLPAHVEADPQTGRLTTVFEDDPQLPFDHYILHFNDGPRAALINPPTCGAATSRAVFTSWARPDEEVVRGDSFQVTSGPNGQPCPNGLGGRPFAPKLDAGVTDPIAGAASPFALKLTREDGEQRLKELTVSTPPGLSAYLRGVPYCPDAVIGSIPREVAGTGASELASPACPAASQLGSVSAASGAGPIPYHVNSGRVYLAGPYKGAPMSLAIIVPAVAGPLDLGNVVVRSAIEVDPATAELTVISDPLPQIVQGIPLDVRSLYVAIDRPHFTLAPTSCEPMSVDGALGGSDGAAAAPSSHFQVGGCGALGFKPRLGLRLFGKTNRGAHPRFRAVLRMPAGGANIARASVALPHSEFLDQAHIRTICTRVQFAAKQCPKGSIYGKARAFTSLLDEPLEGPVYLRSNGGERELPDLVVALHGPDSMPIEVDLVGRVDSFNGRIRTTFESVPDAPVSKFVLEMQGGKKGLLVNSTNLCKGTNRATVKLTGQNGKTYNTNPVLKADCKGGKKGKHGKR